MTKLEGLSGHSHVAELKIIAAAHLDGRQVTGADQSVRLGAGGAQLIANVVKFQETGFRHGKRLSDWFTTEADYLVAFGWWVFTSMRTTLVPSTQNRIRAPWESSYRLRR